MSRDSGASLLGRGVRLLAVLAVVGFVGLLVYGLLARSPDSTIDDALARAQTTPAPAFTLDVLQGGRRDPAIRAVLARAESDGRVGLSELRGAPVVLNFWASWCVPCREEAPVLEAASRRFAPQGVVFVGIDMQDAERDARDFLRAFDISYLNVRDLGKGVARRYGATGIPETFFLSANGDVAAHVVGAIDAEALRTGVAAARSGRPTASVDGGDRRPTR